MLDGEIHVTLKDGKPYSLWNIVSLAHHATQGVLTLKTTCAFNAADYPGRFCTHRDLCVSACNVGTAVYQIQH